MSEQNNENLDNFVCEHCLEADKKLQTRREIIYLVKDLFIDYVPVLIIGYFLGFCSVLNDITPFFDKVLDQCISTKLK